MTAFDPKNSQFLTGLVKHLNYPYTLDALSSLFVEQRALPWSNIFYYDASINAPAVNQGQVIRIPSTDALSLSGQGLSLGLNAFVGAFQISTYMCGGFDFPNPFTEDVFIRYMLNMYGNIKVFDNGQAKKFNYTTPVGLVGTSRSKKDVEKNEEFVSNCRKWEINLIASFNAMIFWQYGIFPNQNFRTKYDDYFKDRIHPALLGGIDPTAYSVSKPPPYLPKLFMDALGPNPDFSDKNKRRLFLLMGGEKYGEHDIPYLNIMKADDKRVYSGIPEDVREYWKTHYSEALQLEGATITTGTGASIAELIGETPSLQVFARYITHGAPDTLSIKSKINSYKSTWNKNYTVPRYTPFATTVPNTVSNTKGNEYFISLAFPDIYVSKVCPTLEFPIPTGPTADSVGSELFNYYGNNTVTFGPNANVPPIVNNNILASYAENWPEGQLANTNVLGRKYILLKDKEDEVDAAVPTRPKAESMLSTAQVGQIGFKPEGNFNGKKTLISGVIETNTAAAIDEKYKVPGPPVGEPLDVPSANTLLDLGVTKNIDQYQNALVQTISNTKGGAGLKYLFREDDTSQAETIELPPELTKKVYAPLDFAISTITKEYSKFEARVSLIDSILEANPQDELKAINDSGALFTKLDPNNQNRESFISQLWIDSVNTATRKVQQWLYFLQTNTAVFADYTAIVALSLEGKSSDDIAKVLADRNIDKLSPSAQSKTPFKIDLNPPPSGSLPGLTGTALSEKLEDRRRNIAQCLLTTNIDLLRKEYRSNIVTQIEAGGLGIHKDGNTAAAFGNRFHLMGHSGGKYSEIPNLLVAPPGKKIEPFLNMTPEIMSSLTPKIRLYKLTSDAGKDFETEFVFENFISKKEIKSLQDATKIEKGRGAGIKSFSFTYEGTTPATAKKDINAELVLYFQTFNELTKERGTSSNRYKYIDLLLYPTNQSNDNIHPNQYNPTNFRIRADVGWNQRNDDSFADILRARYKDLFKEIKKEQEAIAAKAKKKINLEQVSLDEIKRRFNTAVGSINKSLLLNMIDHDIDFKNDGSVEVKITYAAYVESQARSTNCNAISTPEIEYFKKQNTNKINDLLNKQNCSAAELNAIKRSQAAQQKNLLRAAHGSIIKRLIKRKLKREIVFDKKLVDEYLQDFATEAPEPLRHAGLSEKAKNKQKEKQVNFYFMGDIIHTVMDCLYEPNIKPDLKTFNPVKAPVTEYTKRRPDMKRFVPLLGSMLYTDYNQDDPIFKANIADIPVSAQYFNEWLVDNVVKSEREIYPLMDFIRDLVQSIVDLMTDACINRQVDVSLMFQTAQIRAAGTKDKTTKSYSDPFINKTGIEVQADEEYKNKSGLLPLNTGISTNRKRNPLDSYYDYNIIYAVSPTLSVAHTGKGSRFEDEAIGTYHFQIGADRGLLKNIKFSKTDMAYLREARYFNQGTYGLLQLGAVYNVQLELFGNTLFYPGMEVFIDPRSFGGSQWDPTTPGSTGNALGIGGYHVITKVTNKISPSGFTTSLDALFQYSGDGVSRTMSVDGKTSTKPKPEKNSKEVPKKKDLKCTKAVEAALKAERVSNTKVKDKNKVGR